MQEYHLMSNDELRNAQADLEKRKKKLVQEALKASRSVGLFEKLHKIHSTMIGSALKLRVADTAGRGLLQLAFGKDSLIGRGATKFVESLNWLTDTSAVKVSTQTTNNVLLMTARVSLTKIQQEQQKVDADLVEIATLLAERTKFKQPLLKVG